MRIIKKKCIKTNRLILKQIQEEDLGSLIDILKNEESANSSKKTTRKYILRTMPKKTKP